MPRTSRVICSSGPGVAPVAPARTPARYTRGMWRPLHFTGPPLLIAACGGAVSQEPELGAAAPLLFDAEYAAKPAFHALQGALE